MLPSSARAHRALRDFAEEVALLSEISHPHIVACYGTGLCPGPDGDAPFLAMEAVTGGDLRTLVTRATSDPNVYASADVARWAAQIASALQHLHGREPKVIYRDLKLENVMLTERWDVRLTDLGLAKVILQDPSLRFGRYVMTGGTGSLKYMAPEVVKSNKANERVDQYAYAIVLWELLARKGLLFMRTVKQPNGTRVEMTPQSWAEEAIKGARPRVEEEWPQQLREIMCACWHPNPLRRPAFAAVEKALAPLLQPHLWTDPMRPASAPKRGDSAMGRRMSRVSASPAPATVAEEPLAREPAAAGCSCVVQ
jgi:serine/threonine protein kinase